MMNSRFGLASAPMTVPMQHIAAIVVKMEVNFITLAFYQKRPPASILEKTGCGIQFSIERGTPENLDLAKRR
jgi:hypothetical protein